MAAVVAPSVELVEAAIDPVVDAVAATVAAGTVSAVVVKLPVAVASTGENAVPAGTVNALVDTDPDAEAFCVTDAEPETVAPELDATLPVPVASPLA